MKEKAARDLVALREDLNKEKMNELERQEEKHNKQMSDERSKHQAKMNEQEARFKEMIKSLEADLEIARKGFEHERAALDKKRTDM